MVIGVLTDFGLDDDEAMLLKGVIWKIAPHVRCADLTHAVPPQNIQAGAEIVARCFPFFPEGSIFVAVVDPGVGTKRRGMAAKIGEYYFVGPDNGLFSQVYQTASQKGWKTSFVELNRPKYFLDEVNPIFHGRDVFAPVAAHLANGVALEDLGDSFDVPVLI
jgi:S-adenosyl-L-methionine hydrolase (adenosine-forming)